MKILLIEDNRDHRELIQEAVRETFGAKTEFDESATLYGGLATLTHQDFDIILFDLNLPDSNAENTIEEIKKLQLQIPIVALSSLDNVEYAKSLLAAGVQDYLTKDKLDSATIHRCFTYAQERKRFEHSLQREIEEKELFCNSLSHDFRGPIRRIDTYSDRLLADEDSSLSERGTQSLELIKQQCHHVQSLIDGLVSYIHSDSGDEPFYAVNLNAVIGQIEAANQDLFRERDVSLRCDHLPALIGQHAKLYLLFENLILNAIKHNHSTPVIAIRTETLDQVLRIDVQDNGPGIEDYFIDQIFYPFRKKQTRKDYSGSGLGLSIAKKIANHHQGDIRVSSSDQEGTTFTLEFPMRIVSTVANTEPVITAG